MEEQNEENQASSENFLRQVSLFEKCSPHAISLLAVKMRKKSYNKGDTILFQGMISNQLYMVASGMVAVSSRKEKITRFLANLEKGAFFGEISLVKNSVATATVKSAVTPTEIYILDHDVIQDILRDFPEAKADVEANICERNRLRMEAFAKEQPEPGTPAPAPAY